MHICTYKYTHVYTYIHIFINTLFTHVYVHVVVWVGLCVHMYILMLPDYFCLLLLLGWIGGHGSERSVNWWWIPSRSA